MADISIQKVNNNDTGYLSRKKLNENDALLAKAVSQKADKSDLENLIGGMINKGSVNNVTDLPAAAEKGWSYVVINERNPDNGLSYIYQYDGTSWNNTGLTAFPADVVVQSDLEKTVNHFGKNGIIKELYVKNELDKDISANFIGSYYIYNIGKSSDGSTGNIYFAKYYSATNEVKTAQFSGVELNEYVRLYNASEVFYLVVDWKLLNPGESFTQSLDPLKQSEVTYFTKENFDLLYNPILSKRIRDNIVPSDLIENISRLIDTGLQVISDTDVSWTAGQYGKYDGSTGTSANWKIMESAVAIKKNAVFKYYGGLAGRLAGLQLLDDLGNIVDFITAPDDTVIRELVFRTVSAVSRIRASFYTPVTNVTFRIVQQDLSTINHTAVKSDLSGTVDFGRKVLIKKTNVDLTWEQGYWNVSASPIVSTGWYRTTCPVDENVDIDIVCRFLGTTAHHVFLDGSGNILRSVTMGDIFLNENNSYSLRSPKGATQLKISHYGSNLSDFSLQYEKFIEGESFNRVPKSVYKKIVDNELSFLFRQINPKYNYKGSVSALPSVSTFGDTYLVSSDFGSYKKGDLVYYDKTYNKERLNLNLSGNHSDLYDVVILGSGAGGIGAAYALKDSGLRVLVIDKFSRIGGTHVNAWINVFAESVPPPFFKQLVERGLEKGYAKYVDQDYQDFTGVTPLYEWSYLAKRFTNFPYAVGVDFDVDKFPQLYHEDLDGKIEFLFNTEFISVSEHLDGIVSSIRVKSVTSSIETEIRAKYFIDATDGALIRNVNTVNGTDYFVGEDSKTRYEPAYGFTEGNSIDTNTPSVNYPTLMYRLATGTEDLSKITANYSNDALIYGNPSGNALLYVNTVGFLNVTGQEMMTLGDKAAMSLLVARTIQHWKKIKTGGSPRFTVWDLPTKKYESYAPMLGIRETYRMACERMLNENSLYVEVSSTNYNPVNLLDKIIAVGSHTIDIHGDSGINAPVIINSMRPYGVPFGCIIPKKMKNVLSASRGAGFTHIAASTFRLNKNIMCLGYAAGKAIIQANQLDTTDIREIDGDKLQLDIKIGQTIAYLETIMN